MATRKQPQATQPKPTAEALSVEASEQISTSAHSPLDRKITVRRDGDQVIVSVPVKFYRRNGRQMILADCSDPESTSIDAALPNKALLAAIAKAYAWQEQLESGLFEGLEDIAKEHKVDRSYVGRMLQLTSLAPDIVESILEGQAFADISLRDFRKGIPVSWEEQRRVLTST